MNKRLKLLILIISFCSGRYKEIAPPHSYIDVSDYDSPKHLAEYLLHLDANPAEYLSYFWWKEHYSVRTGQEQRFATMCELCARLNNPDEPHRVVEDIDRLLQCDVVLPWRTKFPTWFQKAKTVKDI